jgi:hypothetical protein
MRACLIGVAGDLAAAVAEVHAIEDSRAASVTQGCDDARAPPSVASRACACAYTEHQALCLSSLIPSAVASRACAFAVRPPIDPGSLPLPVVFLSLPFALLIVNSFVARCVVYLPTYLLCASARSVLHRWLDAAQNRLAVEQAVAVLQAQCATLSAYHFINVEDEDDNPSSK